MSRRYEKPPVIEAICGLQLGQDTPWDPTVPGLFYERLRDELAHPERRTVQEVEVKQTTEGISHLIRTTEQALFLTKDRKLSIQMGVRSLSIHVSRPYPGWEKFSAFIQKAWNALSEVVPVQGLESLALRYINQIELSETEGTPADYFRWYPHLPEEFSREIAAFSMVTDFFYQESGNVARVMLNKPGGFQRRVIFLDITYASQSKRIEPDKAMDWIQTAHSEIKNIFESCITERLRNIFRALS